MSDEATADHLQPVLMCPTLRVYTNPDVVGCEIGGAVKNVIALAAGMATGLGYGDNTLAALVTRGLAELTRLGVALGGQRSPSSAWPASATSWSPATARAAATDTWARSSVAGVPSTRSLRT